MYYKDDRDQLGIDEFFLPFGGKLKKDNRWVRMAEIMPWDYIEEVYLESMSQETGRPAFPAFQRVDDGTFSQAFSGGSACKNQRIHLYVKASG